MQRETYSTYNAVSRAFSSPPSSGALRSTISITSSRAGRRRSEGASRFFDRQLAALGDRLAAVVREEGWIYRMTTARMSACCAPCRSRNQ